MKMFSSLLAILLVLSFCTGVSAQDEDDESVKDFMEAAVYFGGAIPSGGLSDWTTTNETTGTEALGAKTGYNIGLDLGHFLTTNLVVGVNVHLSQFGIESDSAAVQAMVHRIIGPAAYFKYYFGGESNLMPYLRGQAGVDVVKFATRVFDSNIGNGAFEYRELSYQPAFAFGVGAGIFYYTHDFGGLFLEANYRMALTKDATADSGDETYTFGETASTIDIHGGITVFFGSD